ncbi:MAG: hypothetical protein ACPH56_08125 [Spongiibacter marinus]|uniref:hypothetical protein n=1 Tax=Spongiibacter TaxID=630749 RepID=UPI000C09ED97|nr:hypothetical protein [Spongiibacter sp.]MAK44923.1 hypothetical protein [Spongiibacter sp.]|tara:strand:+ start:43 stop:378 length:336 start_codon:yes stop_codon:yes gene_type:complete
MSHTNDEQLPLLDELQSLKTVLSDTGDDIPVLNDIIHTPDTEPAEASDNAEQTARNSNDGLAGGDDDHSREIFLQELIDDMLPDIEAELRRRLLKLDGDVLERWYQQSRQR